MIRARAKLPGPLNWSATSGATTQASSAIGRAAAAQTPMMPPSAQLGQADALSAGSRGAVHG